MFLNYIQFICSLLISLEKIYKKLKSFNFLIKITNIIHFNNHPKIILKKANKTIINE